MKNSSPRQNRPLSSRERRFLAWALLGVFGAFFGVLVFLCSCALASPQKQQEAASRASWEVAEIQGVLRSEVASIQNELWPLVGLLLGLGGLVLAGFGWWVRYNSYLEQKPKWLKEHKSGR